MSPTQRMYKVQKRTKEVLGEAIGGLKDPRIGFATITTVRVTPDLRQATVYVSVLGDDQEQRATLAGLRSARSLLQAELARHLRTKFTPELRFEIDHTPEDAERIERLIHQTHEGL